MRKPSTTDPPVPALVMGDDALGKQLPMLVEYLTSQRWDDGTARETSTLLIFHDDGMWKGVLNDRALARAGWASGGTLEALLHLFERLLSEERLEWRKAKQQPRKGR